MTTQTLEKPAKTAMNGVDVPTFLATLGVVGGVQQACQCLGRNGIRQELGTHIAAFVDGPVDAVPLRVGKGVVGTPARFCHGAFS